MCCGEKVLLRFLCFFAAMLVSSVLSIFLQVARPNLPMVESSTVAARLALPIADYQIGSHIRAANVKHRESILRALLLSFVIVLARVNQERLNVRKFPAGRRMSNWKPDCWNWWSSGFLKRVSASAAHRLKIFHISCGHGGTGSDGNGRQ